jgi:hypothetical protein
MMYYVFYRVSSIDSCPRALQCAMQVTGLMTNTSIYLLEGPCVKYRWYKMTSMLTESGGGVLEAVTSSEHAFMVV